MNKSLVIDAEETRLARLAEYHITGTLPEEIYDTATRLASFVAETPMSLICFADRDIVYIKSRTGFELAHVGRQDVCIEVILSEIAVEIADLQDDASFRGKKPIPSDEPLIFYYGEPLASPDGAVLGCLAVLDTRARQLTEQQKKSLKDIAWQVMAQLESRKTNYRLNEMIARDEEINTLFNSSAELHGIVDQFGNIITLNKALETMLGYQIEEVLGQPIWKFFFEEDVRAVLAMLEAGLRSGQKNFKVEARVKLKNGDYRWLGWYIAVKNMRWYVNGRDISEEKKMIAELEQLSLVANRVNNGVVISDNDSRVIWVNEATQNITGYLLDELKGKRLGDVIAGEKTDPAVIERARELTQKKQPFSIDIYAYRKDGTPIWLSVLNSVILDANGEIDREVEVIIDITSRKKVEEELETLSLVASKSESGVVIRDGQGKVTWINAAIEEMLGYSLDELRGRTLSEVVVGKETDMSVIEASRKAIREKKSYRIDLKVYRRDGTPIWIHSSTTPILNEAGEIERQVEIINDITEQKAAEDQLTLVSLVASKTVNGVAISTAEGKITWVNKALENLTGYTLEDFKNTRPGDLLAGEGTDMELLQFARNQAANCQPSNIELLSYRKDGAPVWLAISNTPTFNKDGSLDRQVEIINDISERKLAEQELIKTREEALQLSKAKETFLSVMSHEIRTPLNAVIGMSNILMEDDPTESQMENLRILNFSAQNLLTLINDILDFTKIETGNMILESVNVNLKDLVSQTLNSFQFKTSGKNLVLRSEIDHRIPNFVKGDNTRLYQILVNLLGNAVKFTDSGEVKLKLDLVGESKKTVQIRFEVSDTGIGIEPDKINYIFDSYTQANTDTTRKYGGTGLGLAITKRLLQLYHSAIAVESIPGKGSVFRFDIEFKRSRDLPMLVDNNTAIDQLSATILVVDDNDINRILASKVLSKWGLTVDFAENGEQALEKIQSSKFDLILMDLHMPVMDGMEAARSIRKMGGEFATLPIVALTASLFSNELETILECGMDGYVMKPFVPGDLYNKIKTLLNKGA